MFRPAETALLALTARHWVLGMWTGLCWTWLCPVRRSEEGSGEPASCHLVSAE